MNIYNKKKGSYNNNYCGRKRDFFFKYYKKWEFPYQVILSNINNNNGLRYLCDQGPRLNIFYFILFNKL